MKRKIFLSLVLLSMTISACVPAVTNNGDETSLLQTSLDKAAEYNLPEVVPVTYANEGDWFNPTPPEEISLTAGKVQLFEFSAVWCTSCRRMAPKVEGLAMLYADDINFVQMDMDLTADNEYGPYIEALNYNPALRPGIYILDPNGEAVFRYLGELDIVIVQVALYEAIQNAQN